MSLYLISNGAMPTTAMMAAVTSGTTIKTMLQVKPFNLANVVEWGVFSDGHASCTSLKVELIETDVAATVTASADADIAKYGPAVGDQAVASIAGLTLSTTATGYTSSGEGSITASRLLVPPQWLLPTQADRFIQQFPLGRGPVIQIAKFGRIRALAAGNAVNLACYMLLDI